MKINVINELSLLNKEADNTCHAAFVDREEAVKTANIIIDGLESKLPNGTRHDNKIYDEKSKIEVSLDELDVKLKVYTVNVIASYMEDPCEVITEIFLNKEEAVKSFEDHHKLWIDSIEDFSEEWLTEAEYEDITNGDDRYLHYIFDGGMEKVFMIESKEL